MNEPNQEGTPGTGCCGGDAQSGNDASCGCGCGGTPQRSGLKSLIFWLVMAATIAVAAWSLTAAEQPTAQAVDAVPSAETTSAENATGPTDPPAACCAGSAAGTGGSAGCGGEPGTGAAEESSCQQATAKTCCQ